MLLDLVEQEEQLQLYTVLNGLSTSVSDKDDLGMLVGYSIVNGLINFQTTAGSKIKNQKKGRKTFHPGIIEQIRFEEVKSTYSSLQETRKCVISAGVSSYLSDIIAVVDPKIISLLATKNYAKVQSVLMKNILASLEYSPRNYKDSLRRNGLHLTEDVRQRRFFARPYDFLTNDYESIQKCFVDKIVYKL